MSALLDPHDPVHAKALRMLEQDLIAWIVTTTAEGEPRAVPVWFLWHEGRVAILTKPDAAKVAHVRRHPTVVVHLQAGGSFGDDFVILRGPARIAERSTAQWLTSVRERYETKYAEALEAYGSPLDDVAAVFSTLIEVEPEHVSAW
ncbi:pyridoxamine 5'-phosphate oxidase family protein [Serinibacter arcticus]|uniref:Pyridoxamine 5'-phosphate oxidase N-terminal domain-containing protein n=1 Tax=Serinibacter arcticus TaxID=1655435 RepID=A0A4Z1E2P7_9MICO|nr:pyridoxamine 5'-phosphate oxidase family protein [Serinibacter arcticus]TGO03921.1 hypothetical protein SERN_2933 [Serinibacter arcticus]